MAATRTAYAAFAGLSASLVGIGLGRFAYTPLIPALIGAHWFAPEATIYLGAANLAGYLAGALLARPLAARSPPAAVLRSMMVLGTAAFFACAEPLSVPWYSGWRFAAGLAGGVIMVLAAPAILPHTAPSRRGLVSGMIFTGVGLGVAASGTLVPLLLSFGLAATWAGLGLICALLTVAAWRGWPAAPALGAAAGRKSARTEAGPVRALLLSYGLNAAGLVPHMIFLVDFVARGKGQGLAAGSLYWVAYGLGAVAGPLLAGVLSDRIGFGAALRVAIGLQAGAVALPALVSGPVWLGLSAVVAGAFTPGIVPVVLGRVHELVPDDPAGQRLVWGRTTIAWALFQAGAAYAYSWVFAATGNYELLFALGSGALAAALAVDMLAGYSAATRTAGSSAM